MFWQTMISIMVVAMNVELVSINFKYEDIQIELEKNNKINTQLLEPNNVSNYVYGEQCGLNEESQINNRRLIGYLLIYFYLFAIVCVFLFSYK